MLRKMSKVTETFQVGDFESPGWDKAKEVLLCLNEVTNPTTLDFVQKIRLLTLSMEAAAESDDWVEFLIVVADELVQVNNA